MDEAKIRATRTVIHARFQLLRCQLGLIAATNDGVPGKMFSLGAKRK